MREQAGGAPKKLFAGLLLRFFEFVGDSIEGGVAFGQCVEFWGDVAVVVAAEAAGGLNDVPSDRQANQARSNRLTITTIRASEAARASPQADRRRLRRRFWRKLVPRVMATSFPKRTKPTPRGDGGA